MRTALPLGRVGNSLERPRRAHGGGPKIAVLGVPARYIPHPKPDVILAQLGLDAAGIANTVRDLRS